MNKINSGITIFTDGACQGNPGPGGYGVVVLDANGRREFSGGFSLTTNNRMELTAAIVGLKAVEPGAQVTLYSDSRYLVDGMTKGWAVSWRAKGWKKSNKEKALNVDLWKQVLELSEKRKVTFIWVQGHAGNRENERCDQLSVQAASGKGLPQDPGYIVEKPAPLTLF